MHLACHSRALGFVVGALPPRTHSTCTKTRTCSGGGGSRAASDSARSRFRPRRRWSSSSLMARTKPCPNNAGPEPRFLHHLAQPEPGEPARAVRLTDPLAPVYEVMILPSLLFVALAVGGGEAAAAPSARSAATEDVGRRRLDDSSCLSTCYSQTCDYWSSLGTACAVLESTYSCDCAGCGCGAPTSLPTTAQPTTSVAPSLTLSPTRKYVTN